MNKKTKIIIVSILLLIVIILAIVLAISLNKKNDKSSEISGESADKVARAWVDSFNKSDANAVCNTFNQKMKDKRFVLYGDCSEEYKAKFMNGEDSLQAKFQYVDGEDASEELLQEIKSLLNKEYEINKDSIKGLRKYSLKLIVIMEDGDQVDLGFYYMYVVNISGEWFVTGLSERGTLDKSIQLDIN